MKRKLFTSIFAGILFLGMAFTGASCSSDPTGAEGLHMLTRSITIDKNAWQWDAAHGRYYAVADLPELTNDIYEYGDLDGYVYILEDEATGEVLKPLPYIYTYEETASDGSPIIYSETISCDFQSNPGTVAFYIQDSDRARVDEYLQTHYFRVVLTWNGAY